MIVKVERNSIIQYAERHNEMMSSMAQADSPVAAAIASKESHQKESAMLDMVSKTSLNWFILSILL